MENLVELVRTTYYNHIEEFNDTLILFKIIFKHIPEERLKQLLKVKVKVNSVDPLVTLTSDLDIVDPLVTLTSDLDPIEPIEPEEPATAPEQMLTALRARQLTGDQRSTEWLMQRVNYITASISACCAGIMGAGSREAQLLEKASGGSYRTFLGGYHTDMGNIFEDITANHYSRLNGTRVHDFRLIPHDDPEFSFLGASTDGITDELTNIEIKTLAGRPLDSKIKKEYFHQMQHQMACLGLAKTHFLEAKYDTFKTLKDARLCSLKNKLPYGIALEFYSEDNGFKYIYSPDDLPYDELLNWMESCASGASENGVFIRTIFWCMTGYQMKVVKRDPAWIKEMGPALKAFWAELTELKAQPAKVKALINARETKKEINKAARSNRPAMIQCLI
jgi:hypothetical protein